MDFLAYWGWTKGRGERLRPAEWDAGVVHAGEAKGLPDPFLHPGSVVEVLCGVDSGVVLAGTAETELVHGML